MMNLNDLNAAIKLNPNHAASYIERGRIYLSLEKYHKAVDDFNKAIELDPKCTAAYVCRGIAYKNLNKLNAALANFNKATEIDSTNAQAYIERGKVYVLRKEYVEARNEISKVPATAPDNEEALNFRDKVNDLINDTEKEIAELTEDIEKYPEDAVDIYYERAAHYAEIGKYKLAIDDQTKSIELEADNPFAYFERGDVYRKMKNFDAAIKDYDECINRALKEFRPIDVADCYIRRGLLHAELKNFNAAIDDFTSASKCYLSQPMPYFYCGQCYQALGDYKRLSKTSNVVSSWTLAMSKLIFIAGNAIWLSASTKRRKTILLRLKIWDSLKVSRPTLILICTSENFFGK